MKLDQYEKEMLAGKYGPGRQRSMELLVKFGEAMGAKKMVPLSSAHTMPKEPLGLLQELTEGVDETGVFTTQHPTMSAFCLRNWQKMGIPADFAEQEMPIHEKRQEVYQRAGFYQTYTCLPMLVGNVARFGDCVSWIGTGLQIMTNSVFGARTNRDGTVVNLAGAITGRTPYYGLLQDDNRKAQVLVNIKGLDVQGMGPADLGAIGYWIGSRAQSSNVAIDNAGGLGFDHLRYLLPPLSVSGSVPLCHVVGVTPEAPTLDQALGGKSPEAVLEVGPDQLQQAREMYARKGQETDLALFGCSHCTINEIGAIAGSIKGRRLAPGKRLWVGTAYQTQELARQMGYAQAIEAAGGVFANACMATIPDAPLPPGTKVVGTSSFKAAHYIANLTKGAVKTWVDDVEACLDSVMESKGRT
ncbi:MAG: aconitase X catalytic domain-containing protein [Desulfarculaceae bacterium]|jgi:hypothetical protein